jgi:hypothetical protein
MRITIDTDELGKLKTDLAEGASADAAIDAGSAPIEHIRRMSRVLAAPEHNDVALQTAPLDSYETPLNPLRAGSAATRQRSRAVDDSMVPTESGHAAQEKVPTAAPVAKPGKSRAKS